MAGIDYTIPGQFKGIQLESPMNAMAQAMQLRGLQESAQMNALKMQEYQQQQQEKNALARIYGNPNLKYGSPEFFSAISQHAPSFYEKIATGEEKRQAAEAQRQLALSTQQTREQQRQEEARKQQLARRAFGYRKIATAEDYGQAANLIERSVREGEISREEGDDMLSRLTPDSDIKQFRNNVLQNMLEPEKALEEQRATEKHAFVLDKEKTDKFERRLKLYQSVVPSVNTIDGVSQIVSAMYQDPDLEPILSQIRPYADALNANLDSFNQDSENWKLTSSGVNPKDIIEAARKKVKDERDANKPMVVASGSQLVSPTGEVIFSAPARENESDLARLQRERAAIAAANAEDPRLKDYDARIAKLVNPAEHLSDLARKQSELEQLEAEFAKDPTNRKLAQRIKEYKDDIRKDTQWKPPTVVVQAPTLSVPAIDMAADRFLTDGTLPTGISKPNRDAIMNRAAAMAKEKGINPDRVAQLEVAANKSALAQLSKTETMVGAFEKNFTKNVKIVENLNSKRDSTGVPLLQKWINVGKKAGTGDPDLAALNIAIKAVQNEYGKIVSGSMGNTAVAVSEIKRMEDLLNAAQTPQDVQAVLNTMKAETKNRIEGFREQRAELTQSMRSSTTAPAPKAQSDVRNRADAILGK